MGTEFSFCLVRRFFRPAHRQQRGIAFAESFTRCFVKAFKRARGNGQRAAERLCFLNHRLQIFADGIDVERDYTRVLTLQCFDDGRTA